MRPTERLVHPSFREGALAAWLVTGPLGHLWSALADLAVVWTRYLAARAAQRMLAGAGRRSRRRR
ncbi:MAG: hypothetical protein ACRDL4_15285 [Thermoleophilaceae bacterium]